MTPGAPGRMLTLTAPALLAGALLLPILLGQRFYYHLGILVIIQALLALSMHAMLRIDQLSLAQAGFMGIGAYASALLTRDLSVPFEVALMLAGLIPACVAALLGPIMLRIRGVQFVLLTFALGETIVLVFVEWVSVFGGNNGLMNIPGASILGYSLAERPKFYVFCAAILVVVLLSFRKLLSGGAGIVVHGLAHNESLVASLGVDVLPYRTAVFAYGALIAGVAGSLYAHYFGFISPEAFGFWTAVNALIMNVLGGVGTLLGPVAGAVLLVPLPELFRDAVAFQRLYFGLTLLALMLFLPGGLGGLLAGTPKGSR